jgi:DinB superfamily
MDPQWRAMLWGQFGAAIDMLENAIHACPDALWRDRSRFPEYWYVTYHTLFFLDYYLSPSAETFAPPPPFTMSEMDPSGVLPDRVYEKRELLDYLEHGRTKCRTVIAALTDASLHEPCGFMRRDLTVVELHVYSLRHVQHHTAQLNLILRQVIDDAPRWVGKTGVPLEG